MTSKQMPEWPEKRDDMDEMDLLDYEEARAEAALERLRLAVDKINLIRGEAMVGNFDTHVERLSRVVRDCDDALKAIGDLPPVQKEG